MRSSFECVGVAQELILVKVFVQIVREQGHTFGYLDRLDSGHIVHFFVCATKGCTRVQNGSPSSTHFYRPGH